MRRAWRLRIRLVGKPKAAPARTTTPPIRAIRPPTASVASESRAPITASAAPAAINDHQPFPGPRAAGSGQHGAEQERREADQVCGRAEDPDQHQDGARGGDDQRSLDEPDAHDARPAPLRRRLEVENDLANLVRPRDLEGQRTVLVRLLVDGEQDQRALDRAVLGHGLR